MLYIFGKRTIRIGAFIDTDYICYPCKSYDREVLVYQSYFHFCFIPVFPIGGKQFEMRCRNCGDETRLENVLRKYQGKTRTPFYLFSALILAVVIGIFWFYWNQNMQKQKIAFVSKPAVGDIYTIREKDDKGSTYYFLRIVHIQGDSISVLHSELEYGGFVSGLGFDDYFVKNDTVVFGRKQLSTMLARDEITSVTRGYGEGSDFNRIR